MWTNSTTGLWKLSVPLGLSSSRLTGPTELNGMSFWVKQETFTQKLMNEMSEMTLQSSADATIYRQLNKRISKSLTRDLRQFNTNRIEDGIEQMRAKVLQNK
jgi:hypothetical protein